MSHLKPIAELESLEEVFDDIVPTQRRPKGVGEGRTTLTPPPSRVKEGEDMHVDMKAVLSEPPRLPEESIDPWPLFPLPPKTPNLEVPGLSVPRVFVHQTDDWSKDLTPPPLTADLGSVAPLALSSPPPPTTAELPVHTGWKVATAGLVAALAVAVAAVLVPIDKIAHSPAQSLAAAGAVEEPPHLSVSDLPVVGFVEEPKPEPVTVNEVAIFADLPTREEPSTTEEARRDESASSAAIDDSSAIARTDDNGEASASEGDKATAEPGELTPPATMPPFDRAAAASALSAAASSAASCRQPGTPAGTVRVSVTIAPSGRATTATVSGAFAGTPVGGCIAKTFRSVRVEPFEGELVTVHKTVTIR